MIIDIEKAKSRMGEAFPVMFSEESTGWDDPLDVDFQGPITVEGKYVFQNRAVSISGTISAVVDTQCDACLKPLLVPVSVEFDNIFREEANEEEGEYGFTGERICLNKMILDELSLQMPVQFLCKEDCKGLCPICGCDRNEKTCQCDKQVNDQEGPSHNPFDQLKGLFD